MDRQTVAVWEVSSRALGVVGTLTHARGLRKSAWVRHANLGRFLQPRTARSAAAAAATEPGWALHKTVTYVI